MLPKETWGPSIHVPQNLTKLLLDLYSQPLLRVHCMFYVLGAAGFDHFLGGGGSLNKDYHWTVGRDDFYKTFRTRNQKHRLPRETLWSIW